MNCDLCKNNIKKGALEPVTGGFKTLHYRCYRITQLLERGLIDQ